MNPVIQIGFVDADRAYSTQLLYWIQNNVFGCQWKPMYFTKLQEVDGVHLDFLLYGMYEENPEQFEHIKKIQAQNENMKVILYTNRIEWMCMFYEVDLMYAFLKENPNPKWVEMLRKQIRKEKRNVLAVEFNGTIDLIPFQDIKYIQKESRKMHVYTSEHVYTMYAKTKDIYSKLDPNVFICIQTGLILNLDFIESLKNGQVQCKNGACFLLNRMNRAENIKRIYHYKRLKRWEEEYAGNRIE